MTLIKRLWRGIKRFDRATGRIRDRAINGAGRLIKAYRKRNGTQVKAHRRIVSVHYDRNGKRTVRYARGAKAPANRQRRPRATGRTGAR